MPKKNDKQLADRQAFIILAVKNPEQAADLLNKKAHELRALTKTCYKVKFLSELLYVNERTIYRHLFG